VQVTIKYIIFNIIIGLSYLSYYSVTQDFTVKVSHLTLVIKKI